MEVNRVQNATTGVMPKRDIHSIPLKNRRRKQQRLSGAIQHLLFEGKRY
jgi:hypothetical protein